MTLVLQIVVLLVVLVGLITIIMSIKNWHWAQMLLVLSIFFTSIGVLVLGLEVFRIHRNIRSKIPALEQRIADMEAANDALINGAKDAALANRIFAAGVPFDLEKEGRMPGMSVWTQRLRTLSRERGRVWRNVKPTAAMNANGQIPVTIPAPTPPGLVQGSIVYVFEQGNANTENPAQGAQYLGEFRVVAVTENGAALEPTQQLDKSATDRIQASVQTGLSNPQAAWSLYDLMPADRHDRLAGLTDEQLQQMFPAQSAQEYVRHGKPASPDDDDFEKAGFDEEGRRVGPENADKVVQWRYDRPLRDYAFLFAELSRQRAGMATDIEGLTLDISRLKEAQQNAQQITQQRTQQAAALTADLGHMQNDLKAVQSLLATIKRQVAGFRERIGELTQTNSQLGRDLVQMQLSRLQQIQARPVTAAGSPSANAQ